VIVIADDTPEGSHQIALTGMGAGLADLAAGFDVREQPHLDESGQWVVGVVVVVRNDGDVAAGQFRIRAEVSYDSNPPTDVTAPMVPDPSAPVDEDDEGLLVTRAPLAPGERLAIDAVVQLPKGVDGYTVEVVVDVDACTESDASFVPDPIACRVAERDETNNRSNALTFDIPPIVSLAGRSPLAVRHDSDRDRPGLGGRPT
jgi:hypothetical protein